MLLLEAVVDLNFHEHTIMSAPSVIDVNQKSRVRRSKIRTKFVLESLRQEESRLKLENASMKKLLYDSFPPHVAQEIISECCARTTLSAVKEEDSYERKLMIEDVPMEQFASAFHDNLQSLVRTLDDHESENDEDIDDQCIEGAEEINQ